MSKARELLEQMNESKGWEVWSADGNKVVKSGKAKDADDAVEQMKKHMKKGYEGVYVEDGDVVQSYVLDSDGEIEQK